MAAGTMTRRGAGGNAGSPRAGSWLGRGGQALLAIWAVFWAWFVVMAGTAEGRPALLPVSSILLGVMLVALTPWKWPRLGGVLALAGAAIVFRGASAWLLMVLPPAVGGVRILHSQRVSPRTR